MRSRIIVASCTVAMTMGTAHTSSAAQVDIQGPPGSGYYGASVAVLPNGNIVVADPYADPSQAGAVYLYDPSMNLLAKLSGAAVDDRIGIGGIVVVGSGNFLVLSPQWNSSSATEAGAVTWVNGETGLAGVISLANSLVGTSFRSTVTVLSNGNYVIDNPYWNGYRGAVTWGSGTSSTSGVISVANSLIGAPNDEVGLQIVPLSNGNYVVGSGNWNSYAGAVTWGDGSFGVAGTVSTSNSLVGGSSDDEVGTHIIALANGNYIVGSPFWNGGTGAVTWCDGTTGTHGTLSAGNSLIGSTPSDGVGTAVAALTSSDYAVGSPGWDSNRGAVTWGSGTSGVVGTISNSNSLVGAPNDGFGAQVMALSNGNYVVSNWHWNADMGAATFLNGSGPVSGTLAISSANSIVGMSAGDAVGYAVIALSNGNYVVSNPYWSNVGAATWGNGIIGTTGVVAPGNSLVGTSYNDTVGINVTALKDGNYVVGSMYWNGRSGAVTWANGMTGIAGPVSTGNSLVGSSLDALGATIVALSDGNYVIGAADWNSLRGATMWVSGGAGAAGSFDSNDALTGKAINDHVSYQGIVPLSDGNYIVNSLSVDDGKGAITLASGSFTLVGHVQPWNSVLGHANLGGSGMTSAYDAKRKRLVVGRPNENIVSLFTMDQIFESRFE